MPMQESFPPEHSCEVFRDSLEKLLDCGGVADEGGGHLEASGGDVTNSCLYIVGDPFNKVRRVLVLNVKHLLIHLLHGHPAPEHGGHRQVPAVPGVTGGHHILGIEHLLGEFWDSESSVLLGSSGSEGGKPWHEEVEPGEGHHVHRELPARVCP